VRWLIAARAGLRASATLQPEAQRISIHEAYPIPSQLGQS
jgi:hypothetical protein